MSDHTVNTSPLSGISVFDAMRPGVVTCLPEDPLAKIAATMAVRGIHAVVLAPLERPAPLIASDLDLVRAALEQREARAGDIAHESVATLSADASLDDAVAMMSERGTRHLLVTAPGSGAPAGMVSSFDIAAELGGQQPRVARMIRPAPARPSSSAGSLSEARVVDVMHPGVATCHADALLATVARSMAEHRVHGIVVAGVQGDGDQPTWGLLSDLDLVVALHRGALDEPVAALAVTTPITVEESASLERAAALMVEHDTSHVVVTSQSGLPTGMISTLDVASILGAAAT